MKMLFTVPDEVLNVIELFSDQLALTKDELEAAGVFGKLLSLEVLVRNIQADSNNRARLCRIGALVLSLIDIDESKFADFLLLKHQGYGAEPIVDGGVIVLKAKMEMKISRLKNLITSNQSEETPADSLQDILGYAVLGYMANKYWA